MRPHSLSLRQFGPYADHTVDLEPFHGAGLFLIHGDTGAGKSTLLDAMSWALYGRGLGDRATDEMLRNVGAPPELPTEVSLDFSLGERRYRVTRTLEPERTSRRGTVRRARTTASLQCLAGDPQFPVVGGPKEVTRAASDLLHLPHEQFSRVIVVPQGEFRDLLLASAKQREQLLEHLFGTERYARIEEQLRALDQAARAALDRADASVTALFEGVGAADLADLDAKAADARARLAGGDAAIVEVRAAIDAVVLAQSSAREQERRNERRRAHSAALRVIADAEAVAERDRVRVERDVVANSCLDQLARHRAASAAFEQRREQLDESRAACERLRAELADDLDAVRLEARESSLRESSGRAAALRVLADDAVRLAALERDIGEGQDAIVRLVASLAAREAEVAEANSRRQELDALVAAHDAALADEPTLRARVDNLAARSQRLADRRSREDALRGLERTLRNARSLERDADEAWREASAAHERAQQGRLRGEAATLAARLVEGEPCLVCGSREHPAPAVARGGPSSASEEDKTRVGETAAALERARREVLTLEVKVEEATAALRSDGEAEPMEGEALAAEVAAGRDALAALRRRRLDAEALRRRRSTLVEEHDRNAAALGPERASLIGLRARVATLDEAATSGRARLSDAGVDPARLDHTVAALNETIAREADSLRSAKSRRDDAARRLAAAEGAMPTLQAELDRASTLRDETREHLRSVMREGGFADEAALEAAVLTTDERVSLRERVEARVRSEAMHREALDALGHEEADDPSFVASLAQAEEGHRARLDALQREAGVAQSTLAALERQRHGVVAATTSRDAAAARARAVRRVSEVANGKGPTKVRLSRYVLLDLFDRVVASASASLEAVSDGRFRLRRQERAQTGHEFDLVVDDAYVGAVPRPVASLSGGEVFLASLAMALGLGEVLQAWSGGIRAESLFVDEGFGSLDEDTIERAVELLERLPRGARMVGVVSHVPELRKRIPARLEVLRGDRGSHTLCSLRHRGGR